MGDFTIYEGMYLHDIGDKVEGIPIDDTAEYLTIFPEFVCPIISEMFGEPETIIEDLHDNLTYYTWKIEY